MSCKAVEVCHIALAAAREPRARWPHRARYRKLLDLGDSHRSVTDVPTRLGLMAAFALEAAALELVPVLSFVATGLIGGGNGPAIRSGTLDAQLTRRGRLGICSASRGRASPEP